MRLTPNLGLKVWDAGTDSWSRPDLASNWDALDAATGSAIKQVQKLSADLSLSALPTLTNTVPDIGTLIYLDIAVTGYSIHSIVRWNGTTWQTIGPPLVMASLPTVGNFQGRTVVLTSSSGGFNANDLVVNVDGVNTWKKVGGVATGAALPGSPVAGDLFLLTSAAGGFDAYSLVTYNGSAWILTDRRAVQVGTTLPSSPYAGQLFVLSASSGLFAAWDVVRWTGSVWQKVGPGPITVTNLGSVTTPVDGMIVIYKVDSTYHWHLRYDSSEGTAFKWKFVGGSPVVGQAYLSNISSGVNGTSIWTVPRSGLYRCRGTGSYTAGVGVNLRYHDVGGVAQNALFTNLSVHVSSGIVPVHGVVDQVATAGDDFNIYGGGVAGGALMEYTIWPIKLS